ncbi:phosphoribosylglycinamide formyltransferase, formyltetrahydrofolate-dependent [Sphaerochaeta pleomorpha str. Grapes]|uniref:Phosphoribosylglycinamide formyltransferase n=1 Tax=Sphaerochaeta pleomorpha (strain ATCC BAA-1885 / DSM 22778 / Grapes) TaxID=158190 RepID=G8QVA6_SPHPG|nr:phosphoribosylglycinamide formyltransferase [Sphaerochaeta pleomorpha]AEV30421.1 phosphoribosylglycinamide formyltransferase, formyltetrahydrofolate-dependent [Sphaerochaeta pleomorpha str. Grapes]
MLKRIAVLCSGGGTNLQALFDAQANGTLKSGFVCLVIANKKDAYALKRAEGQRIATLVIEKHKGQASLFEQRLSEALKENSIDLVVLAGFLCILSPSFVRNYPNRIINIHPSLIPSFCGKGYYGLTVHRAALEYGVKVTGATVHYVNEIPDGGAIIAQKAVSVLPGDTPESLQKRVMEQAEWVLLPQCVETLCAERGAEMDLKQLLKGNRYPGRGILVGVSEDNQAVVAYFIMGRSENSRNRIFREQADGLKTEAFDPKRVEDPSLIIYSPVRSVGNFLIVTNGDQSDTIYDFLSEGKTFEQALQTRCYEPDEPNYTPRISAVVKMGKPFGYSLSILKRNNGECERLFYQYDKPEKGTGHLIHTYESDGAPLPPFEGPPKKVSLAGSIDAFTEDLWDSLDSENRISLFVRYTNLENGKSEQRIINKNKR